MGALRNPFLHLIIWIILCHQIICKKVPLPSFQKLKYHYPGQHHFGGRYTHKQFLRMIGVDKSIAPHDTSSLRLSFTLNKLGPPHSHGRETITLSTRNADSVAGRSGLQYIHRPIAFGPYLADKYGDPSISVLHHIGPEEIKRKFWNRQGILQIISYTKKGPKGHIALWDCNHFYQADDWIVKHSLITTEFWETSDSYCKRSGDTDQINDRTVFRNHRQRKPGF